MSQRALFDPCLEGPGLSATVYRSALPADLADRTMDLLLSDVPWSQNEITMFGKRHVVPRLEAWFGDPGTAYTYSGIRQEPRPWTQPLLRIRSEVAGLAETGFNSVLVNRYRSGRDGVGWHADDEPELGPEPLIASVSLGASRRFQFRRRDDTSIGRTIELHHGDVVIMSGPTQSLWHHQIPKTAKPVGERINLTFRTVFERPH